MSDANPTPLSEEEVLEIAEEAAHSSDSGGFDMGVARKAKDFWPSFWRMMGLMKPYWARMILVTIVGAASVVLTVLAPRILGQGTDVLFSGYISKQIPEGITTEQAIAGLRSAGQTEMADMVAKMNVVPGSGIDFDRLGHILLLVLALYVGAAVFSWLQGYVLNRVMVRAMWKLRGEVEDKINRLPLSYFDRVKRGDLISRVTNDIDNMTNTLQQSLSGAITSVFTVIGALIMMLTISWQLTLIALISFPLLGVIFGIIGPKSQKAFNLQWLKVGRLNARVEESFSGHALIKVFGQQKRFEKDFAEENDELYRAAFKAQFLSGLMMPMMSFVGNLVYVGIAVIGGVMVAGGSLLLGSVQAFIQYSTQFNQPLAELGGMAASVQSGVASTERVFELLDAEDQSPDNPDAPAPVEGQGRIAFEHVKFSYSPDRPLIRDLSFTVEPGQTVAIVGPTGAGKTTLVNLLMRFYELDGGRITVNGQDIAQLKRDDVRRRTGMVLQNPWLFAGTISENIRYGNEDATEEQITAAAKATYVDRLVRQLPRGYDTELDEEASNLSAGERQLLTIARAFVAQPPILILDEATSSVDTRTERLLQEAMNALQKGRTSFVIAHRLSTIREADLILVMEDGDIVEKGSHDELIEANGAYRRLYDSQFEGALDE
ncbi:ABC transporter ATP-binding protein [Actinomyces minihominis]|uniref:ABC transporter ATP-binding protein n=1 Tax=Actinomyces minihominis TaxID=2002838 RepID=UPI000C0779AE